MKKLFPYGLMAMLILTVALSGCGGGSNSGGNSGEGNNGGGNGGNGGLKTADPYPSQIVDNTEHWESNLTYDYGQYQSFLSYLVDITGISDSNSWPQAAQNAAAYLGFSNTFGGYLLVSPCEYKTVSNVPLFEYTNWYQPNSTLGITLSSINETAVTNSITMSVGLTLGYDQVGGFSASIAKESSKTVTTAKGIEVATTYDLTQYDQSKLYKVVLTGTYAYVRYHFRVQGATALPSQWNTDGNGYIGYIEVIKVRQDSLTVKLVHN